MISPSWYKIKELKKKKTNKQICPVKALLALVQRAVLGHSAAGAPGASSSAKAVPTSGLPLTLKPNLKIVGIRILRMFS